MSQKSKLIISWNVNGIRAAERKGFLEWLQQVKPDILCVQETKAWAEQLSEDLLHPKGYETFWSEASRKGYSGTAVYARQSPEMSITNFEEDWLDEEGRVIMLQYPEFVLFNIYFPNGGSGPERLQYKLDFYDKFIKHVKKWKNRVTAKEHGNRGIIICGDYNTAHHEIDLARPKPNIDNSGFMPIERQRLDILQKAGFFDTYRHFHPDQKDAYSYWDQKTRARDRNVGWRIDYFWATDNIRPKIKDAFIWPDVMGSDHCPVGVKLSIG